MLTLGLPVFPPKGLPGYLLHMPPEFLARMPQPESADPARKVVEDNLAAGAVGTKLFLITPRREGLTTMPPDIARAAADATHAAGRMVVAHPTDIAGVRAALATGVDLLAHTTLGNTTPWPEDLLQQVGKTRIAMTPTLKLMGYEETQDPAEAHLIWSWKDPFFVLEDSTDKLRAANALLPKLARHQYINQVPVRSLPRRRPRLPDGLLTAVPRGLPRCLRGACRACVS